MNTQFLISNLIAGTIVILTYIYYLPKLSLDDAWGNIKGTERNLTMIYMIIAALSFSYILYHYTVNKIEKPILLYTSLVIFFMGAILWAPSLYNYFSNKTDVNLILMYLTLCITTIGTLLLFIYIFKSKKNYGVKIAITLFLFHILFLDNLNYATKFIE
jgi:hypothetical protein